MAVTPQWANPKLIPTRVKGTIGISAGEIQPSAETRAPSVPVSPLYPWNLGALVGPRVSVNVPGPFPGC